MTILQRVVTVVGIVFVICIYWLGYYDGKQSVKLDDFEEYKTLIKKRDILQTELNDKDVALLEVQQERNELRDKKVTQYVTVYRDRIKDPAVAQCVRSSGLLNVYDATVSTPGE